MKMNKMIGAVALTAALAMGSVPAFASTSNQTAWAGGTAGQGRVGSEMAEWDATTEPDGAKTEIRAEVEKKRSAQLQAEVPLKVVVVFESEGLGKAIQAPASSVYGIKNTGTDPIYVNNVELAQTAEQKTASGLTFTGLTGTGSSWKFGNGSVAAAALAANTNYVMLTYKDGVNVTWIAPDHNLKAADGRTTKDGAILTGATDPTSVEIASGATLPIELGGLTCFQTAIDSSKLTDTLCTIKYTLSGTQG